MIENFRNREINDKGFSTDDDSDLWCHVWASPLGHLTETVLQIYK